MYEVISQGERVALVETPRYIKLKPSTGAFIETDEQHAEGVAINGKGVYSLNGKLKKLPEAEVRKIDGGEYVFDHEHDLAGVHGSLLDIETALCELDLG